ncbi:MAG: hypothetical protein FWF01_03090, partial [Alphaproteobacteria bacterium]|nr:hypothetical protein [Alphaproteobacteria bacterium]
MVVINKLGEIDLAGIKSLVIAGDRLDRNLISKNLQALNMNDMVMCNPDISDVASVLKQRIVDVVFIHAEPDISRTFAIIKGLRG